MTMFSGIAGATAAGQLPVPRRPVAMAMANTGGRREMSMTSPCGLRRESKGNRPDAGSEFKREVPIEQPTAQQPDRKSEFTEISERTVPSYNEGSRRPARSRIGEQARETGTF